MILENLSLRGCLDDIESILRIEITLEKVDDIIRNSRTEIENYLGFAIEGSIEDSYKSLGLMNNNLDMFTAELTKALERLSIITNLSLSIGVQGRTLRDDAYVGFAEKSLHEILIRLGDKYLYNERSDFLEHLKSQVDKSPKTETIRFLVAILVLESLDIREGVYIIAQYLLSGMVQ